LNDKSESKNTLILVSQKNFQSPHYHSNFLGGSYFAPLCDKAKEWNMIAYRFFTLEKREK
jgi:hypothetical protein